MEEVVDLILGLYLDLRSFAVPDAEAVADLGHSDCLLLEHIAKVRLVRRLVEQCCCRGFLVCAGFRSLQAFPSIPKLFERLSARRWAWAKKPGSRCFQETIERRIARVERSSAQLLVQDRRCQPRNE